ncbi:hypothetical protein CASFOL_005811 [Castilleja foliolosa]|uniref:Uncharacterized protein n=1 Tax=Castilleja foliolosa TaxID=1961234 RepID=A0ABD3E4J7_9LAMI
MEPSTPAKPQQLHNFELPNLKWITDGKSSSGNHHRRRSIKSPSPIRQSLSCDSVSAPPRRHQSPKRGESPKPSPAQDEAPQKFRSVHSLPDTEASRKGKGISIVYRRNHSINSASSGSIRNCSSGTGKAKDKIIEEKPKAPEEGGEVAGIKRSSKILIKIPGIYNTKPEGAKNQPNKPLKIVVDPKNEPAKIVVDPQNKLPKIAVDNNGGLTDGIVKIPRINNTKPGAKSPQNKPPKMVFDPKNEPPKIVVVPQNKPPKIAIENNGGNGGLTDEIVTIPRINITKPDGAKNPRNEPPKIIVKPKNEPPKIVIDPQNKLPKIVVGNNGGLTDKIVKIPRINNTKPERAENPQNELPKIVVDQQKKLPKIIVDNNGGLTDKIVKIPRINTKPEGAKNSQNEPPKIVVKPKNEPPKIVVDPQNELPKIVVDNNGDNGGLTDGVVKIPRINNTKPVGAKNPHNEPPKVTVDNNNNGEHDGLLADETVNILDEEKKVWNLRPRMPKRKSRNAIADPEKTEKAQPALKKTNKTPNGGEKEKKDKKEKEKLSICISLSNEEIDDDIYALTGTKPSRRLKKRAKTVQKKLDTVFPGLCLVSISPDSYKKMNRLPSKAVREKDKQIESRRKRKMFIKSVNFSRWKAFTK